jgi:glycosyltransferase involved in cell wall biosynthesis
MASGVPIAAPDLGGVPEMISNGQTGLLFSAGDADAMSDAIIRLIEDPSLRERLARAAQLEVKEKFSVSRHVTAIENVFDSVL